MAEQTLKFPFNKSKEAGVPKGPREGPFFHFPFAICHTWAVEVNLSIVSYIVIVVRAV